MLSFEERKKMFQKKDSTGKSLEYLIVIKLKMPKTRCKQPTPKEGPQIEGNTVKSTEKSETISNFSINKLLIQTFGVNSTEKSFVKLHSQPRIRRKLFFSKKHV